MQHVGAAEDERPTRGTSPSPRELAEAVRARAGELGFARAAIARADEPLDEDFARYERFLGAELHGTMRYLAENREARRRLDGEAILEGAKSVVCLADRYRAEGEAEGGVVAHIARYARGRDYHVHLRKRLRALADFVRGLGSDVRARPLTDTAPVLERAWAARAGLGFVGKNGLLIVPGEGSFVLLGEVATTLELAAGESIEARCGACTRCLDACPTRAFAAPFVLDARQCVAYLTIEHRGPVAAELSSGVGEHLFGCDVCQEVCPYNRAAPGPVRDDYAPLARWRDTTLEEITRLDPAGFEELTRGSPLRRATREGLADRARIVLDNQGARGS